MFMFEFNSSAKRKQYIEDLKSEISEMEKNKNSILPTSRKYFQLYQESIYNRELIRLKKMESKYK